MWLLAVIACAACGRVGFDPTGGDGGDVLDPDGDPATMDYCLRIPALGTTPSIDGVLEPDLALRRVEPEGWTSV